MSCLASAAVAAAADRFPHRFIPRVDIADENGRVRRSAGFGTGPLDSIWGRREMRLFFFGSLMDPDLFALVVGRPMSELEVAPGRLHGYRRHKVADEIYPILVPQPGGVVEGLLVDGLTDTEIDRLQFFEGGEYALHPLPVTDDEGRPVEAHAYVSTGILKDAGEPWHLEAWAATEKHRALAQGEELMALYGKITLAEMDACWDEIKERAERRLRELEGRSARAG